MVSGERRPTLPCLVVCPPGLEDVVTAELDDLGIRARRTGKGSISADLTTRQLYAANLFLRSATRVLVRVARFTVRSFADLERWIREVDWDPWIGPEDRPRVRVTTRHSKLWHDGAVAERFTSVLGPGSEEGREQLVVVRAVDDRFTVSVDSSGAPLHERGWRQATARAPLRESVAAALLTAARWDPTTPLVDPLCGSGTIAIEAALRATGSAPAGQRDLAFQSWPGFEPGTWASVTAEADRRVSEAGAVPSIVAADRDAGAIESAQSNAQRAGVEGLIEWRRAPIADLAPPAGVQAESGLLATNPPWGGRVSGGDLRNLYATLGRVAAERFAGWSLGVLVADRGLARQVRPGLTETLDLELGGRRAWFLTGRVG
ncbi:MAG: class I SAM-dependent RNA methyltransferase [Actinomycetota bacterium]|nr:class I SAM-dependent RNA methyltransferase [Actinomycetota bacterium]